MKENVKDMLLGILKTIVFIAMVVGIPVGVWLFLEPITFWQKFALMIVNGIIALIMYGLYFKIEDKLVDIVY